MIGLILGNIMVVLGVFSIIKGKLPLIKRYNGVKNIKLHSRIEGTAILLVGIMLIFQCFISLGNVEIGFKREFSKLIGFLVVALIAVGLVFNAGGVKDVLLELFNKIIGA